MDQKFEAILGEWFIKQASNYVDNEIRQFEVGWSRQGDLIRVYVPTLCMYNKQHKWSVTVFYSQFLSIDILGALHD